jgi:hypothetical protein
MQMVVPDISMIELNISTDIRHPPRVSILYDVSKTTLLRIAAIVTGRAAKGNSTCSATWGRVVAHIVCSRPPYLVLKVIDVWSIIFTC